MPLPFIGPVIDIVGKVLDRVIPDPKQRAEAALAVQQLQQSGDLAAMAQQADINKIEAASPSLLIAGWRPAIGWVCGAGLAMAYVVGPLVQLVIAIVAVCHGLPWVPPVVDMTTLGPILMAMLGMAGLRTWEKVQNAEGNRS